MTTLSIRIEEKAKAEASKTLARLGLDMSSAVKLFLCQVVKEDGLPFTPTNNLTIIRARFDAQVAKAKKDRGFKTAREALKDL
ncbi:MAG: type II toxin-antitoxin system RelB/DinJ family antitoxin [Candidatus Vogelbacteria bacterium]|nr:type II toxin-antitoxin system RelB/DinJ family antitoxin [Candidatus Vogelbacteria bacterium]